MGVTPLGLVWDVRANWRRNSLIRPIHHETLARLDSLKIEVAAPTADALPRLAVWFAAWLAGQLDWSPVGVAKRDGGKLAATFRGPSGEIAVAISTTAVPTLDVPHLLATTLTTRAVGDQDAESFRLFCTDAARSTSTSRSIPTPIAPCPARSSPATSTTPAGFRPRWDPRVDRRSRNVPHALWMLVVEIQTSMSGTNRRKCGVKASASAIGSGNSPAGAVVNAKERASWPRFKRSMPSRTAVAGQRTTVDHGTQGVVVARRDRLGSQHDGRHAQHQAFRVAGRVPTAETVR